MTFTQIMKNIFSRKPKQAVNNSDKQGVRRFMSKISGAFMLPISIMAVAGLFLGVGAAISSHTSAVTFGNFIKNLGDPIFGAMPLLFMIAIIVSFTEDIGTAVFAGTISFLVFNAIQNPFMDVSGNGNTGTAYFLNIDAGTAVAERMYKIAGANLGIQSMNTSIFGGIIVGFVVSYLYKKFYQVELPTYISFFGGKRFVSFAGIISMIPLAFIFLLIWPWIGLGLAYFGEYSGKVFGLDSLIFGFVERSLIPFGLHHVFYAPLWWTSAGGDVIKTINDYNGSIEGINNGAITSVTAAVEHFDSLRDTFNNKIDSAFSEGTTSMQAAANVVKKAMIGTNLFVVDGTHHIKLVTAFSSKNQTEMKDAVKLINNAISATITTGGNLDLIKLASSLIGIAKWDDDLRAVLVNKIGNSSQGDSFGWLAVNGSGIFDVTFKNTAASKAQTLPIFKFISEQGLRLGRFMQGKFAFMQLGLPAAGVAMIMAAPKENRKTAAAVIVPAATTSFVTGVTEPIEFTFLFLAPWLFWGFHAGMAALSFFFMNIFGAHVGMTFSGGIIDTIIYGAIPWSLGTNFYWMYVIGIVMAPIYFVVFYWAIKKFNLETPGRGENKDKLFTKKDFQAKSDESKKGKTGSLTAQSAAIVAAYGGWDNIKSFNNCATRLRYDVKDANKVDEKALKAAGAAGIMKQGKNHVQAIMGTKAEQINSNIKANKGEELK